MRAQERLLQRVLSVLAAAEHVAAEREQRRVVAVVQRLERGLVATGDEVCETLVADAAEARLHRGLLTAAGVSTKDIRAAPKFPFATAQPPRRPAGPPRRPRSPPQEGNPHAQQEAGRHARSSRRRRRRGRGARRRRRRSPSTTRTTTAAARCAARSTRPRAPPARQDRVRDPRRRRAHDRARRPTCRSITQAADDPRLLAARRRPGDRGRARRRRRS